MKLGVDSSSSMDIEYEIRPEDQRVASTYRRRRVGRQFSRGWLYAALQLASASLFAVGAAIAFLHYPYAPQEQLSGLTWSLILVILGGALATLVLIVKRSRMDTVLLVGGREYPLRQSLSVSGRGLKLEDKYAELHLGWNLVDEVEEYQRYVAVALKDTSCFLVPREAVGSDDDVADFIDIAKQKMNAAR